MRLGWLQVAAAFGLLLGGAGSSAAEQRPWSEVRATLYMIAHHRYPVSDPSAQEHKQGIWRFDPRDDTWSRLAPFFFNCFAQMAEPNSGQGAYLKSAGDRLIFQVLQRGSKWIRALAGCCAGTHRGF
jgi:hypothetical protein